VADTGLLVPPRDPAVMAAACVLLLRDELLRRRLGEAARRRALDLFTVDRAVGSFQEIYADLGAGPDRTAIEPDRTAIEPDRTATEPDRTERVMYLAGSRA
jgi:hypothetical protein